MYHSLQPACHAPDAVSRPLRILALRRCVVPECKRNQPRAVATRFLLWRVATGTPLLPLWRVATGTPLLLLWRVATGTPLLLLWRVAKGTPLLLLWRVATGTPLLLLWRVATGTRRLPNRPKDGAHPGD